MTEFSHTFRDYLKTIGMSNTLCDRAESIYHFYADICNLEIKDLFVTDFINSDGVRQFQNLWFFNDYLFMEAHDFVTSDKFDSSPIHRNIKRWEITKSDYDFNVVNDKSKLKISIYFYEDLSGNLNATKENCAYLMKVFKKYVLPNCSQQI